MLVTLALILFLAFASVAALLVRRYSRALRANEMELERARSAQLQYEAALRLSGTLVTEEIYSGLRELTARVMACDGMIVSSYDDEARTVRCVYLWVNGHQLDHTTLPVLPIDLEHGTGMQTEVIRTGEGRFFGDVQKRVTQGGRYYDVSGDGKVRDLSGPEAAPAVPQRASLFNEFQTAKSYKAMYDRLKASGEAQTPEGWYVMYEILRRCALARRHATVQHRDVIRIVGEISL